MRGSVAYKTQKPSGRTKERGLPSYRENDIRLASAREINSQTRVVTPYTPTGSSPLDLFASTGLVPALTTPLDAEHYSLFFDRRQDQHKSSTPFP